MNDEPVVVESAPEAPLTEDQIEKISSQAEDQAQAELDGNTSKLKSVASPESPVEEEKSEEVETPETPVETPATAPVEKPVETTKPVAPATPKSDDPVRFDVDKYTERINEALKDKVYRDDDGKDITEQQAYDQYGQVLSPMRDRLDAVVREIVKDVRESIEEIRKDLEPAKAIAATQAASQAVEAENRMLTALEKAGASDARALLSDPRMIEFVQKNPQYNNLISTDAANPDRVNDVLFLIDRFRAKAGISKPASTPQASSKKRMDNSIIAGKSTARGGGSPARDTGDDGKSPEQIMEDEEEKLLAEKAASRKQFGV
jgi:hypothetical protein